MVKHDKGAELPATRELSSEETTVPSPVLSPSERLGPTLDLAGAEAQARRYASVPSTSSLLSLGRFQLIRELGRGGMGRVLEARDPAIGRTVAVKVVIDREAVSEAQLARFVAEARISGQLEHPNIVPVYDMGVTDQGDAFFVMKRVEGRSLREVLEALLDGEPAATESWTRHRLLTAFVQVCNAVAYAHDLGVIHRDIKPGNIMLGRFGEVLLMDWGVARVLGRVEDRSTEEPAAVPTGYETLEGSVVGTPGYMSPEQARGEIGEVDWRSDVWSLGLVLFELLTHRRAYDLPSSGERRSAVLEASPGDPRERSPELRIPGEIAGVCERATALRREDRTASAQQLAAEVQAFLDGSRRRAAAQVHLEEAREQWASYQELAVEREEVGVLLASLEDSVAPWTALSEKRPLLAARRRRADLLPARAAVFGRVIGQAERALAQDPDSAEAREILARAYWSRFCDAEAQGDAAECSYYSARVREYDDGLLAELRRGTGALSLRTNPPGAEVSCRTFDGAAPVRGLGPPRLLGRTPLEAEPLPMGSYVLTLRAEGYADACYPVRIARGQHWDAGERAISLLREDSLAAGFVYVPPGPFLSGGGGAGAAAPVELWVDGFALATFPVSMREYLSFLNDLHQRRPEEAWERVPRVASIHDSSGGSAGQYFERPGRGEAYVLPAVDRDGDCWDLEWPANSVSWDDAQAYTRWASARDEVDYRLPTELEWEKAARGVDGRLFPWGDDFDPALCKMMLSRPGRPQPEKIGAFPTDVSVYGVRDLAGGVRDWCGDQVWGEDPLRRPIRGGSWSSSAIFCRTTHRFGHEVWHVDSNYGFRLARSIA